MARCYRAWHGPGAGNTPLEQLLVSLDSFGTNTASGIYDKIFDLALTDFTKMQGIYRWGPSLPYFLSAAQNIHPTYVQEMLKRGQFSRAALSRLKDADRYDPNRLQAIENAVHSVMAAQKNDKVYNV